MSPKVMVVIVNWNSKDHVLSCLRLLGEQTYKNLDIMVVDNASVDGSADEINGSFPDVRVIRSDCNLGWAGGVNRALRESALLRPDYYWLLNTDTDFSSDVIERLVQFAELNPQAGTVAPVLYFQNTENMIQNCGSSLDWKNFKANDYTDPSRMRKVPEKDVWLWGTALLIRKKVIERVGFFNESYFAYCEDLEYGRRVVKAGFLNKVDLSTGICHKYDVFNPTQQVRKTYVYFYITRNSYLFWRRNIGWLRIPGMTRRYVLAIFEEIGALRKQSREDAVDACLDGLYCALKDVRGSWDNRCQMPARSRKWILGRLFLLEDLLAGRFLKIFLSLFRKIRWRADVFFDWLKKYVVVQKCLPYFLGRRLKFYWVRSAARSIDFFVHEAALRRFRAHLYSFNIFDTVLTRRTAHPQGIFLLMSRRLKEGQGHFSEEFVNSFYSWRVGVECDVRERLGRACSLEEMYQTLVARHIVSVDQKDWLLRLEEQIEYEECLVVPRMASFIRSLRQKGAKIVFTSDMYLSQSVIRGMLMKVGCLEPGDEVYISGEHGVTKSDGGLFRIILKNHNVDPHAVVHIGDNMEADLVQAKRCGIRAFRFTQTTLNRYEELIAAAPGDKSGQFSFEREILAGLCRNTRLQRAGDSTGYLTEMHDSGSSIFGPILTAFVIWVLRQAHLQGVRRLYFIARDGQLLLQIARTVIGKLGYPMELRYLYGSRHAWFLSSLWQIRDEDIDRLLMKEPFLSVRLLANRTGLEEQMFQSFLKTEARVSVGLDENIDQFEELIRGFLGRSETRDRISVMAREKRDLVTGYFRQEGLLEDVESGIVDLGWRGTMQRSINQIRTLAGAKNVLRGFYFGLDLLDTDSVRQLNRMTSYYFANHESVPVSWRIKDIMEFVTSGDHGVTLGYTRDPDGKYIPVLKELVNQDALNWGLASLRSGINGFVQRLVSQEESCLKDWDVDGFCPVITQMLDLLVNNPTRLEAEILGSYLLKRDMSETYKEAYAPPFRLWQALTYSGPMKHSFSSWLLISYLRSPFHVKAILRLYENQKYQKFLGRPLRKFLGRDRAAVKDYRL